MELSDVLWLSLMTILQLITRLMMSPASTDGGFNVKVR